MGRPHKFFYCKPDQSRLAVFRAHTKSNCINIADPAAAAAVVAVAAVSQLKTGGHGKPHARRTSSRRTYRDVERKDVSELGGWRLTAMLCCCRCLRDCRAAPILHYNACASVRPSVEKLRRVSSEARTAAPGWRAAGGDLSVPPSAMSRRRSYDAVVSS